MADPSTDLAARGYTIVETLSSTPEGGRTTYLAEDRLGKRVVLKRFAFASSGATWSGYREHERELATLRELSHPRIPRYVDSFATDDGFCLVQEWIDLRPISARGSFEPEEVKAIALSVLDILVALQRRLPPVIHRDLKPQNILVDDASQAYLVDFGLARAGASKSSTVAVGTPGFIAPEQVLGRELGPQTDLYGLGATLIAMLTGTPAEELGGLVDHSMRFDLERLPRGLSPAFVRWLEAMVAPNPAERHADAATARDALAELEIIGRPTSPSSPTRAPRPAPTAEPTTGGTMSSSRRWGVLLGAALPMLTSGAALFYFLVLPRCSGTPGVPGMASSPLLVDVDSDGDDELVYLTRKAAKEPKLVALQTPEHDLLWSTEVGEGVPFAAPGLILQQAGATLTAYELEDGAKRWSVTLSDEVREVRGDERALWVACTDRRYFSVALDSGARSDADAEPPPSMPRLLLPWSERIDAWSERASYEWSESWEGLRIEQSYCRKKDRLELDGESSCAASLGVAYAVKSPGTSVPYIVGFERPSGEQRWKRPVLPEGREDGHQTLSPRELQVGLDSERAYVAAQTNISIIDPSYRVFALDIESGELVWARDFDAEREFEEVVVTDELLYIRGGRGHVLVLDKQSGEPRR